MKIWYGTILILNGLLLIFPQDEYIQIVVGIFAVVLGLWALFGKNN